MEVDALLGALECRGHLVRTLPKALNALEENEPEALLIDIQSLSRNSHDALRRVRAQWPSLAILAVVPRERTALATRALREGADDYVLTPLDTKEVRIRLERILEHRELRRKVAALESDLVRRRQRESFVSKSPLMRRMLERLGQVAPARSMVQIRGESGVGKELVARAIHYLSPRRDRPYVALNCSAIPDTLIESELFGHERGAFTGAVARSRGKFELAHRGTLFLDEVGELSLSAQARLLRVLEEQEFMRVGGERPVRVDVRVLAATNADLEAAVRGGKFRGDLYFRLNVISLDVPPLRQRIEDIPELTRLFVEQICATNNLPLHELAPEVLEVLKRYYWPGNVRELKNLLEGLIITSHEPLIRLSDLPSNILSSTAHGAPAVDAGAGTTLEDMERQLIRRTLESLQGNRTRAARLLKIGVRTLQRKIQRYGLQAIGRSRAPAGQRKGERRKAPLPVTNPDASPTMPARPSAEPFRG
jgi:DNA-binding NtrC family response regulator